MNEGKKDKSVSVIFAFFSIVTALLVIYIAVDDLFMIEIELKNTAEECKEDVYTRIGKSDEYIQGWLDGIDYLVKEFRKPTNVTTAIIN